MTGFINRRLAVKNGLTTSFSLGIGACQSSDFKARIGPQPLTIKPNRLRAGDTIGLIAPGGLVDDNAIDRSVRNLQSQNFKVKLGSNIGAKWGGYAGTPRQRVDDLHTMFSDPTIKAIWAVRGGSGANALLPWLDFDLIQANPKILIGYSDVTALLLAINYRTGLVCFHGPVASSTFSDFSVANLKVVLMEAAERYTFKLDSDYQASHQVIHSGIAQGRLMGGNLSVITALSGTPYLDSLLTKLLFLEEVSEAPYRIDRMFNQLQQIGLSQTAAVMLGVFTKCDPPDLDPTLTLNEVLSSQLRHLSLPSVYGYPFGHITGQLTLPIGVLAQLDTHAKSLTLLEAAVQ